MRRSPVTVSAPRLPIGAISAGVASVRLPALDAVAPMDAAEAFRDLPGLALLESARPGRTGR